MHVVKIRCSSSTDHVQVVSDDIKLVESQPSSLVSEKTASDLLAATEMYMILGAVVDRAEMHNNMMEQRNNWNTLLLNSVNMMTLTATTMAGLAAAGSPSSGLRLSSFLLFSAATGLLAVMNKIQPSQLAEEQRNATRLFKQIQSEIETVLSTRDPEMADVETMMGKILALDRAYPLPLIEAMLEKFPEALQPSQWWLESEHRRVDGGPGDGIGNGWDESLEAEMREIVQVMKVKDSGDYARLGNLALKLNKALAVSGPVLTSVAAVGSAFVDSSTPAGSVAAMAATIGGALACAVNSLEHGGQVGMVFEMYRNCAGFFGLLEESIESSLKEGGVESRVHGDLFEMKVALKLGRSVSQLRELAAKSSSSRIDGVDVDEFASKLF
uniref:F-box protein n=1 Tax=Kalanchoe fedtschenkoi TaxID=63787 RepID=A0A7N0UJN7_KALFE